ncbi:MAG: transporter substrate-binding domain-containing protein [Chloroflexi bacterium]|nr:transporter substrate-binding domain-containing protein [Chloroflexota bacterium]
MIPPGLLRTLRRRSWLLALPVFTIALWWVQQDRVGPVDEVFPDGTLTIGIDPSYAPFGSIVGDTFVGVDIELGKAVAAHLGLEARFVMVNFDSAYDAVRTHVADVSFAAIRVADVVPADVYYTWGYLNDGLVLISHDEIDSGWSLAGQHVAVELGARGHTEARRWSRRVLDLTVVTFESAELALRSVTEFVVADAAIIDAMTARQYASQIAACCHAEYLTAEFYAGAVSADRRDVLYHVNNALLVLLNDGTIDQLLSAFVGPDPSVRVP